MKDRPRTTRRRALVAKVLLLSISTLLAVLVAEIAVRLFVGPIPTNPGHHKLLCEHDPLLGWRKVPNAEARYTTTEYDVEVKINSRGLRGPELGYEKTEGVYRVLVLGDSFTEGYTVDAETVFVEVMGRELNEVSERRVEAINGGTGGYSTDQELLFYRSEGQKYEPDLVLLMFVGNDPWFNAQGSYPRAAKPLFRPEDGRLVLTNTPLPEPPPPDETPVKQAPKTGLNRIKSAIAQRSALYQFARDRVKGTHWLHSAAIRVGLVDPLEEGSLRIEMPDEWLVYRKQMLPEVRAAWDLTEAILRTLRDDVEEAGAELLVVNIPPAFDLNSKRWGDTIRTYGVSDVEWSPSTVTQELIRLCRNNDIELLDLTDDFAAGVEAGRDRSDPFYFRFDGHWTANGHVFAGEVLARYVAETRLEQLRAAGTD